MRFLLVAVAGAAGALSRYGIGLAVGPQRFPWATLAINITGSFLLGVVLTVSTERQWSPEVSAALAVGFLGAYTTFSTFTWEAFALGRTDRMLAAAVYVVVSVAVGVGAAAAGYSTARLVLRA